MHSKIINKVAKEYFKPHSIKQKGRSRIWLDTQDWFSIIIEFQPFSGRLGTALNVAVNFHWLEQDYFSFDVGGRIYTEQEQFIEYKDEDDFEVQVKNFCEIALIKISEYRNIFNSFENAKDFILTYNFTSNSIYGNYHKYIICRLTKNSDLARKYFQNLLSIENEHNLAWIDKVKNAIRELNLLSDDEFFKEIQSIIKRTKIMKKIDTE